jgi:putative hydrolase
MTARDPVADLRDIAFRLERAGEATYRVQAFRGAAKALAALDPSEVEARAADGTLRKLPGVGEVTARCVVESLAGEEPVYLRRLVATSTVDLEDSAAALLAAIAGDCHSHSDWSDGGSPIEEMALAAVGLGHRYLVVTDHSPRLTVANGLTAERLRRQLKLIAAINEGLPPGFRLLTGIEVDILADGSLDQDPELLAQLDVVVGSVHSGLRDDSAVMTHRMLTAVANPHLDILGHCTGRRVLPGDALVGMRGDSAAGGDDDGGGAGGGGAGGGGGAARSRGGRGGGDRAHRRGRARPESTFDAEAVFAACARYDKAVEINCRPDRLDPPKRLLRLAVEAGCRFSIDTDAHAPGQLDWLPNGCVRAARCAVPVDGVVNTWSVERLLEWSRAHAA